MPSLALHESNAILFSTVACGKYEERQVSMGLWTSIFRDHCRRWILCITRWRISYLWHWPWALWKWRHLLHRYSWRRVCWPKRSGAPKVQEVKERALQSKLLAEWTLPMPIYRHFAAREFSDTKCRRIGSICRKYLSKQTVAIVVFWWSLPSCLADRSWLKVKLKGRLYQNCQRFQTCIRIIAKAHLLRFCIVFRLLI